MRRIVRLTHKYNSLGRIKVTIISAVISFFITIILSERRGDTHFSTENISWMFTVFLLILSNLTPAMLILRLGSLRKIKEKPRYAIYLIIYFLFFIPILIGLETSNGIEILNREGFLFLFISVINIIAIVISHVILIRYMFLDVVLKRRKPTAKDTVLVLMTYISLGVTFGFFHTLITLSSKAQAYNGIHLDMATSLGNVKFYLRHVYYSFITLTSVGFGDIYPLTWLAQLTTIIEALLGVFLLSFSLGMILSAEAETDTIKEDENNKFREELLEDIGKLLDEKLKNIQVSNTEQTVIKEKVEREVEERIGSKKPKNSKSKLDYLKKFKKILKK